jgi:hypothetical protein
MGVRGIRRHPSRMIPGGTLLLVVALSDWKACTRRGIRRHPSRMIPWDPKTPFPDDPGRNPTSGGRIVGLESVYPELPPLARSGYVGMGGRGIRRHPSRMIRGGIPLLVVALSDWKACTRGSLACAFGLRWHGGSWDPKTPFPDDPGRNPTSGGRIVGLESVYPGLPRLRVRATLARGVVGSEDTLPG